MAPNARVRFSTKKIPSESEDELVSPKDLIFFKKKYGLLNLNKNTVYWEFGMRKSAGGLTPSNRRMAQQPSSPLTGLTAGKQLG
jgi:hypothetical protein